MLHPVNGGVIMQKEIVGPVQADDAGMTAKALREERHFLLQPLVKVFVEEGVKMQADIVPQIVDTADVAIVLWRQDIVKTRPQQEKISRPDPFTGLELCHLQGKTWIEIHVMPQDSLPFRAAQRGKGDEAISFFLKGIEEILVSAEVVHLVVWFFEQRAQWLRTLRKRML